METGPTFWNVFTCVAVLTLSFGSFPPPVRSLPEVKETNCGISAKAPIGARIVGGDESNPHAWPWQVLIQCRGYFLGKNCGGSIISDKWVITAAHCVEPTVFNIQRDCRILIGKHHLDRKEGTEVIADIGGYFVHEAYKPYENQNAYDLALYKLAKPLKFTYAIKPICLPFGLAELPYNKSCYATGWGHTKYGSGTLSDRLMQLSMRVTDERHCFYPVGRIVCTAQWERNKDVCNGDSGGPLACQGPDRKWYLRGVISMANGNCDLLAISTKVSSFEAWIKNITSRN